ncbi:MAG: efflux RND transporter periplasmic adaptor subunit [Thermoguttaceae bacterium]
MTTPRIRILLAIGLLTWTGCGGKTPAAVKPPIPEVTVAKPEARTVVDYVEFPGQTAAVGEVEVRARVTGYVVKIHFQDGQEVKKGDLLFEIDPRPYRLALDRAKGELARLRALADKAKADLARAERLRPSGALSLDDYEQAVANLKVHQASIQTAEAAVDEAELSLEFTRITSPIDGRVSRRLVTEGNLVQADSSDSSMLTTVVTVDPVYVYFNIEEPTLLKYERLGWRAGDKTLFSRIKELKVPVEIGLADEDGFPHVGQLDFVDNKVDPDTGTIRARGRFDKAKYLTPGMFVRVRLPIGPPHQALLVSERAIGTDQRQKFVLTVDKDNVVRYRQIQLGSLRDGLRVVESGLKADDRIIVQGLQRARSGFPVSPHTAEKSTAETSASPGYVKNGKSGDVAN